MLEFSSTVLSAPSPYFHTVLYSGRKTAVVVVCDAALQTVIAVGWSCVGGDSSGTLGDV